MLSITVRRITDMNITQQNTVMDKIYINMDHNKFCINHNPSTVLNNMIKLHYILLYFTNTVSIGYCLTHKDKIKKIKLNSAILINYYSNLQLNDDEYNQLNKLRNVYQKLDTIIYKN